MENNEEIELLVEAADVKVHAKKTIQKIMEKVKTMKHFLH